MEDRCKEKRVIPLSCQECETQLLQPCEACDNMPLKKVRQEPCWAERTLPFYSGKKYKGYSWNWNRAALGDADNPLGRGYCNSHRKQSVQTKGTGRIVKHLKIDSTDTNVSKFVFKKGQDITIGSVLYRYG